MKITFVNHASVIFESGNVRLMTDPWLEGQAFNHGWGLLSKTQFSYDDFRTITHLWFSHEHPDHFSPPCIKKIPEDARRNIEVLYQETSDKKVVEYCRRMGFKAVRELESGKLIELEPGFELSCTPHDHDSWMYIRTPGARILNLNDCQVNTEEESASIRETVGDIDVLLTQFSISAWDGNEEDIGRRRAGADTMLERTVMQSRVFQADYVVPFASFIWFCHEENFYMNSALVPVNRVCSTIRDESESAPILMYPGDEWTVGEDYSVGPAIERYLEDLSTVGTRERHHSESVTSTELIAAAAKYVKRLTRHSSRIRWRARMVKMGLRHVARLPNQTALKRRMSRLGALLSLRIRPARIYVTDHETTYLFDLRRGLRRSDTPLEDCDIVLGSDSLYYGFKFLWGGETLQINGRFQEAYPDGHVPLFEYYWVSNHFNAQEEAGTPF